MTGPSIVKRLINRLFVCNLDPEIHSYAARADTYDGSRGHSGRAYQSSRAGVAVNLRFPRFRWVARFASYRFDCQDRTVFSADREGCKVSHRY